MDNPEALAILNNTDSTKNQRLTQVLGKGKQFLPLVRTLTILLIYWYSRCVGHHYSKQTQIT